MNYYIKAKSRYGNKESYQVGGVVGSRAFLTSDLIFLQHGAQKQGYDLSVVRTKMGSGSRRKNYLYPEFFR